MKQALTEALADDAAFNRDTVVWLDAHGLFRDAARLFERLLPTVTVHSHGADCWCDLGESGEIQVWDEGIVEAVSREFAMALGAYRSELTARAFVELCNAHARSVLSALVELLTEKVET